MPLFPQGGGLYPDSIDNAILADMPEGTLKGRVAGSGTGNPVDLTPAQIATIVQGANLTYRNLMGRNGGLEVFQRGAGGTTTGMSIPAGSTLYAMDGWAVGAPVGNPVATALRAGLTNGSQWSAYVQRNPGATSINAIAFEFPLDTDEIACARGSVVTLSMTMKAGTTFSGNMIAYFSVGSGTPRKLGAGFTGRQDLIIATVPLTTTATRFVYTSTLVVPLNAAQATLYLQWNPVGTAGADDAFYIDDVQLEVGLVATPFERRPFEQEMWACQRHYWKTFAYGQAPMNNAGTATAFYMPAIHAGALSQFGYCLYPRELRANSAGFVTAYNPTAGAAGQVHDVSLGASCSGMDLSFSTTRYTLVQCVGAPGTAIGDFLAVHISVDVGI